MSGRNTAITNLSHLDRSIIESYLLSVDLALWSYTMPDNSRIVPSACRTADLRGNLSGLVVDNRSDCPLFPQNYCYVRE
jgi:hypothetical protein